MGQLRSTLDWLIGVWLRVRPSAHTKLALATIGIGGACVAGSLPQMLFQAYGPQLGVTFPDIHPAWGLLTMALGWGGYLGATAFDHAVKAVGARKQRAHDRRLIEGFLSVTSQRAIEDMCVQLGNDHSYWHHDSVIEGAVEFLARADHQFADTALKAKAWELIAALHKLAEFKAYKFFVMGSTTPLRFCLMPEWNVDRWRHDVPTAEEQRQYEQLVRELDGLLLTVRTAYASLVEAAHSSR